MQILLPILLIITVFDASMGIMAHLENNNLDNVDEWLYKSQVIEPDYNNNGKTIILFHGFVGSPNDFKPLAKPLVDLGFKVVIPVIPGQIRGTDLDERNKYKSEDYITWAEDFVSKEVAASGPEVYMIGFSMGGTLSSLVAQNCGIKKLVLLSPFYELPVQNDLIKASTYVLTLAVPIVPKAGRGRINSKEGYEKYTPGTFYMSLNSFIELEKLADIARKEVPNLNIPTLVFGSRNDQTASFSLTKELYSEKKNVILKEYENSNHILLYDYDSKDVIKDIIKFLEEDEIEVITAKLYD